MTLDTTLLAFILGILVKVAYSLNTLENTVIKHTVKLEYLDKHLSKLEKEIEK